MAPAAMACVAVIFRMYQGDLARDLMGAGGRMAPGSVAS